MSNITLLPVVRADCAELIAGNLASREYHAPWLRAFGDEAGFETWFTKRITGPNVSLVARDKETGGIVGVVNLSEIVLGVFQNAYLGYCGMVNFARRGLMTEAVRGAAQYAFGELGLHRIEAAIQPANLASIALVKRVGFRKEGFSPKYLFINEVWADCERWALVKNELV